MKNQTIEKVYNGLQGVCVFCDAYRAPITQAFLEYAKIDTCPVQKHRAYANFVTEIYRFNGSLADAVFHAVAEDENVYVKRRALGVQVAPCIVDSARKELDLFSMFASLTTADFCEDLGVRALPAFESRTVDFAHRYEERMKDIGRFGYGIFASYGMFRFSDDKKIVPITSADKIPMAHFVGYETEREKVVENTRAFLENRPSANVLLYGDAGTGKSSTVKAVANEFFARGLRLIELRKDQLRFLPLVMESIRENPLKFLVFIDDLSFSKSDDNFSMLKASLEGSASAKADNCILYATSNRRHIVRETFADREGGEVHRNDTLQETLSLSERFGLTVYYPKPDKKLYLEIVKELALRQGLTVDEKLFIDAEAFALKRGNRSARCAEHFVDSLL